MIVSHDHRFIFLKTAKTAGTSIEIALSRFCGPSDVITPITPEDETIRREIGNRGPQNFRAPLRSLTFGDWMRFLTKRRRPLFRNHMDAHEVRKNVGADVWERYFKFAVERNPWDKVVSAYAWHNRAVPHPWPTLAEWVRADSRSYASGYDIYSIRGVVAVDRVLRYETLEQELGEVGDRLGFAEPIRLPRAKSGFRHERRPYQELFDDGTRRHVAIAYAREIALLGYQFEGRGETESFAVHS